MSISINSLKKLRVLIIEDNRDLAANMYDFLEAKGHIPDAADSSDGEQRLRGW